MGTLYLVRHGQASFGADDYDQLSELGQRQCQALGQALAQRGLEPAAVLLGTLRRHQQSWQALATGLGPALRPSPRRPGQGSTSTTVWRSCRPLGEPLPPHDSPEGFKAHFRRLRQALTAWMAGEITPHGMPRYLDFRAGVLQALSHAQSHHVGQAVLVVSSGGPISTAVAHVLGAGASAAIDLNMRLRNSSLTELVFSAKRMELLAFNTLPHLEAPDRRSWVSYA